ncbi:DUF1684 domain-containing protein [Paeniglutamicibacter sp. ORCA_105]|uniref:DUF1684 domain-containing protein n=1 Tax=Paeniglutamicibacter sp. ORCA_105 TaxID=3377336 RepID=UPI003893F8FE
MDAAEEFTQWRRMRDEGLAVPFGWLSLSSYQWLPEVPRPLDLVPGVWSADASGATAGFEVWDSITTPDGDPVHGTLAKSLHEGESMHFIRHGDTLVELGVRGGRYMIRTRERTHPRLKAFTGVPVFDHDPTFIVPGRYTAFHAPKVVPIDSFRSDTRLRTELVGEVEFELAGHRASLAASRNADGSLTLAFRDQTNGVQTAPRRFVTVKDPGTDGDVAIDFNRTLNYPMAFSPHAVCPAPVPGNRLEVPVRAGELMPR